MRKISLRAYRSIFLLLLSFTVYAQDPFHHAATSDISSQVDEKPTWQGISLQHVSPQVIVDWLSHQRGLLQKDESVTADGHSQRVWIWARPSVIKLIGKQIPKMDHLPLQVSVSARVVQIDEGYDHELGVEWKVRNHKMGELQMSFPSMMPRQSFMVSVAKFGDHILDLSLAALENRGHGRVVARPHLLMENHKEAVIEAGDLVPYESVSDDKVNVQFKKAALRLQVTPTIFSKKHITLDLGVNHDKVSTIQVSGKPIIQTQALHTQVVVSSGQTVVLGGIYQTSTEAGQESIPILGKLPIFGQLFRLNTKKMHRKELLIFLTPTLMSV